MFGLLISDENCSQHRLRNLRRQRLHGFQDP